MPEAYEKETEPAPFSATAKNHAWSLQAQRKRERIRPGHAEVRSELCGRSRPRLGRKSRAEPRTCAACVRVRPQITLAPSRRPWTARCQKKRGPCACLVVAGERVHKNVLANATAPAFFHASSSPHLAMVHGAPSVVDRPTDWLIVRRSPTRRSTHGLLDRRLHSPAAPPAAADSPDQVAGRAAAGGPYSDFLCSSRLAAASQPADRRRRRRVAGKPSIGRRIRQAHCCALSFRSKQVIRCS